MRLLSLAGSVALASMVAGIPAHAFYNNLGRDGDKGGAITKADLAILKKALAKALNDSPDGKTSSWKNDATGAHGTIQPVRSVTWKTYKCRIVNATIMAKTYKTPSRYRSRMCNVPGRGWVIAE